MCLSTFKSGFVIWIEAKIVWFCCNRLKKTCPCARLAGRALPSLRSSKVGQSLKIYEKYTRRKRCASTQGFHRSKFQLPGVSLHRVIHISLEPAEHTGQRGYFFHISRHPWKFHPFHMTKLDLKVEFLGQIIQGLWTLFPSRGRCWIFLHLGCLVLKQHRRKDGKGRQLLCTSIKSRPELPIFIKIKAN